MLNLSELTKAELYELFEIKYGSPATVGWSPKRRLQFGYYHPSDVYDATIKKLVNTETKWIDVGGGRKLLPYNNKLSKILSKKCKKLVAVDPSQNVMENPYAHEQSMCMFEDFQTSEKFDLATFRMVAEHIENPEAIMIKLKELLNPDGVVVIYTINKFSPIPIVTYLTPFSLHYKIKNFFWGGEEKDTFPVAYLMNTRRELSKLFNDHGFLEESFQYLDDLSTFARFKFFSLMELIIWKVINFMGLKYPEHNLLGVYQWKG